MRVATALPTRLPACLRTQARQWPIFLDRPAYNLRAAMSVSASAHDGRPPAVTAEHISGWRKSLHADLQDKHWYTVLVAALASAHEASAMPKIYELATSDLKQDSDFVTVHRRIKEALIKGSVLYGIPSAIESTFALQAHLKAEAQTHPGRLGEPGFFARKGETIEGTEQRGREQLAKVYAHNYASIGEAFGDSQDLLLLTIPVNYGLILSNCTVIDFPETELVILAAIIPQNLRPEALWHMRGSRRAGWSDEVIESVRTVSLDIARFLGRPVYKVPSLAEVSEDSND